MWVRKPTVPPDMQFGRAGAAFERRLAMKGANVHMPVLNQVQHLYVRREVPSDNVADAAAPATKPTLLCGAEVHTPATCLVAPNASTIHS